MPYTQVSALSITNFSPVRIGPLRPIYPPEVTLSEDEVKDLNKYTMRFYDGKSSIEFIPAFTPPQAFTVDFIAKLGIPSEQNASIFLLSGLGYASSIDLLSLVYGNNSISFMRNGSVFHTTPMTDPFIGEWHRYTVEWNSNVVKFYFDGILKISTPWTISPEVFSTFNQSIIIGGVNNPSVIEGQPSHTNRYLNADIVQFRVFDGPATIEEVLAYDDTPLQIREDGVNCLRMDEQSSVSKPLLLDYTKWVVGQTPPSPFSLNGAPSENHIVSDTDPWGVTRPIWRAFPDAVSGPDGGWNASINASSNNTYRLTCFIRRDVIGNGNAYFGCQTSLGKVQNSSNLSDNTNPYFWNGVPASTEWMLFVSYCHKDGTPAGISMPDTGVYSMDGTKLNMSVNEFILPPGITSLVHRSYLYNSTDVNTRQSWCYPRIDIVDGSEPSISELLACYDRNIYDTVKETNNAPKAVSISNSIQLDFTEIGITRGLKLYLPFTEDKNDYWKGMHSLTDTGNAITYDNSVPPITGALFQNTTINQYLSIPLADLGIESGKDFTVTFLSRVTSTPPIGTLFSLYDNINNQPGISYHFRLGLTYNLRMNPVGTVSEVGQISSAISSPDTWVFNAISLNTRTGKITRYRQDLNTPQSAPFEFTAVPNLVYDELRIAAGLNNVISEFKVFNVALTREEMVTEYLRNTAIASVGKGIIQTSGTFNEL